MTGWFARPVLHVTDIEASLLFYVNRLGFTSPWRYDEDGRAHVAQVDRQGCALITYLYETRQRATGKRELCRFSKPRTTRIPPSLSYAADNLWLLHTAGCDCGRSCRGGIGRC